MAGTGNLDKPVPYGSPNNMMPDSMPPTKIPGGVVPRSGDKDKEGTKGK